MVYLWIVDYQKSTIIFVMIRLEKHSKRELKQSKIIQKEVEELNREAEAMNRRHDDRNEEDEDGGNQFMDRKGKNWWHRFDQRNFLPLSQHDCLRLRDVTLSDRILQQSPREALQPASFAQIKILPQYDLLAEEDLIHILFKTQQPSFRFLASYFLDPAIPSYSQPKPQTEEKVSFRVTPSTSEGDDGESLKEIKLSLAGYNEDQKNCKDVQIYKRALSKMKGKTEIQQELSLWEKQLSLVQRENSLGWEKVVSTVKAQPKASSFSSQQITKIRDYLMWVTVLKYFEHGFADKTREQLQQLMDSQRTTKPAKSKESSAKKFFQTDCKICFCSFNNDSNQVLYCDKCDTSFHLACYGLQELPRDETYYCDACKIQKKQDSKKTVSCQLCNKSKFPMKCLQGHFYHLTCLILFNLVAIDRGAMILRRDITHQSITQMVTDNQLNLKQCQACSSFGGIRLKCGFAGCDSTSHPICAYINGCKFWIKRDSRNVKLNISYYCNKHDQSRDWIYQTYLRRYMCNFKDTSEMKEDRFRQSYLRELSKKNEGQDQKYWNHSRVIMKTRYLKNKFAKEEKQAQNKKEIQTQSRKYLEKFRKKLN